MSVIKERPILFNGAMVRAILEGRKTVTRRACKPQPSANAHTTSAEGKPMSAWWETGKDVNRCPYGQPGERLWVRETWSVELLAGYAQEGGYYSEYELRYRANDGEREISVAPGEPDPWLQLYDSQLGDWRPSIHMPRAACRILLEITDVRVERLQDITYEQAAAEGIHRHNRMWSATDEGGACHKYPEPAFRDLWLSTGGDWDANPWVWVVEFKRIEQ